MELFIQYIIIIAVFFSFVLKIISGVRKRVEKENDTALPTRQPEYEVDHAPTSFPKGGMIEKWEKWFDDDIEEETMPVAQEAVKATPSPTFSYEADFHKAYEPMQLANERHVAPSGKEPLSKSEVTPPPISLKNREEMRRAILYSEIINRKY